MKRMRWMALWSLRSGGVLLLVSVAFGAVLWRHDDIGFSQGSASTALVDIQCSSDAACPSGMFCSTEEVCRAPFSCPMLLSARWRNGTDLTAGGVLPDIRNGEYLSLVPLSSSRSWFSFSRSWALRVTGGPAGEHTYERVLMKRFAQPITAFAGRMRANLSKVEPYFTCSGCSANAPVMLVGGYNSSQWPADGTWTRDLTVGATARQNPIGVTPPPYPVFGGAAYHHDNLNVGNTQVFPLGQPLQWPDRMVDIDWYVTPAGNMYMRADGQSWVRVSVPTSTVPVKERRIYGVALGWVSSQSGGSIDIERFQLYPLECATKPSQDRD